MYGLDIIQIKLIYIEKEGHISLSYELTRCGHFRNVSNIEPFETKIYFFIENMVKKSVVHNDQAHVE